MDAKSLVRQRRKRQLVWHRGLDNNMTQLLAALFTYQLLLRYNRRKHRYNGQIQWSDSMVRFNGFWIPYEFPECLRYLRVS